MLQVAGRSRQRLGAKLAPRRRRVPRISPRAAPRLAALLARAACPTRRPSLSPSAAPRPARRGAAGLARLRPRRRAQVARSPSREGTPSRMPLGATSTLELAHVHAPGQRKTRSNSAFRRWGSHIAPPATRRAFRAPAIRPAGLDVALDVEQLHAQPLRDAEDALVAIELAVDDAADAGVRDLLEAVPARARGHVDRRAVDHHAVLRGLDDRVRLGVDRGDAVTVFHHVAGLGAVGHAADRSVVAGRQDCPIAHDHRADELARAGRARRDDLGDVHEVLVPGHPLVHAPVSNMSLDGQRDAMRQPMPGIRTALDVTALASEPDLDFDLYTMTRNRTHCVTEAIDPA